MRKSTSALRVRGLRTPRILIWFRGLLHGKILHSGGLDPETGVIASGYVAGQTKRFIGACVARRDLAERRLADCWAGADRTLLELPGVKAALAAIEVPPKVPGESGSQARAREKAEAQRASVEEKRLTLMKSLSDFYNTILKEYNEAADQMETTASRLLSCFSAYGHGLTLQPVFDGTLPDVPPGSCADCILNDHRQTWTKLITALKEDQP